MQSTVFGVDFGDGHSPLIEDPSKVGKTLPKRRWRKPRVLECAPNRLRELRVAAGYSAAKLGERVGISGEQIRKLETGERRLRADDLAKLAGALGVSLGELLNESAA